jgi:metal-responsive CopG/Arc/MetJ family transcriptional regulator
MAVDKEKNTQVLVTFPNDLLKEIEKYWHENHLKNRSEAIRELVKKGIEASK